MRRHIGAFLAAVLAALLFSGCSASAGGREGSASTGNGGEINLFIWTEYMPQSVLDRFYQETGTRVNITTFSSMADMYSKVKSSPAGTYDVVDVAGFYIDRMAKENLIDKLEKEKLPNLKNMEPAYLKQNEAFDPGNEYAVPYQVVAAALCYNRSVYPQGLKTYEDLFKPEFKESLVLLNDPRAIIGTVNLMLGYDFSETDPNKLEKTKAKLMELKPNVKVLDSDSPKSALISGECGAGLIYTGEIALAQKENPDIVAVFPEKGEYFGMDCLCVMKAGKNKEKAEEFLNFLMRGDIGQMVSSEFPYISPNSAAIQRMGKDYIDDPVRNVPASVIEKGKSPLDVGKSVEVYDEIWTDFTK